MGQGRAGGMGEGHVSHFSTESSLWMLCFVRHQFDLIYVHLISVWLNMVLYVHAVLALFLLTSFLVNCLFCPCPLSQCLDLCSKS